MPWEVEQTADTVVVRVGIPMTDWDGLMRHLPSKLSPLPRVALLPASIPGGTAYDARMLKGLWTFLMEAGVPIQREATPRTPGGSEGAPTGP